MYNQKKQENMKKTFTINDWNAKLRQHTSAFVQSNQQVWILCTVNLDDFTIIFDKQLLFFGRVYISRYI